MTTTATPRTRPAKAAPAASNGTTKSGIVIPGSASELKALLDELRITYSGLHGGAADVAAFLKAQLPAVIRERGGSRLPMGLDAAIMARRVVKPLYEMSKLSEECGKLAVVTWMRYQENVENVRTNHTGKGRFNADA